MNYLNQSEGIEEIVRLIDKGNLIPILGSGFTKGSPCYKGNHVPDGSEATKKMKDLILMHCPRISKRDIDSYDFTATADLFLKNVDKQFRGEYFRDYYTEAEIGDAQKAFLSYDWPYIYTLNVDDAIDRTTLYHPVVPYRKLNHDADSSEVKFLYKIHGDAFTEYSYDIENNIVFSSNQYISSLMLPENKDLLNNLKGDLSTKNILYLGCSLDNEPDLKFIYSKIDHRISKEVIFIANSKPCFLREQKLSDYGVNTVLLVDDFTSFYRELDKKMQDRVGLKKANDYRYKNPEVIDVVDDKETGILFAGGQIFDENLNEFKLNGMTIDRDVAACFPYVLKDHLLLIIKGRRFSGKTTLLCNFIKSSADKDVYYFPSQTKVDVQVVARLIKSNTNSYFIFDSNSMSEKVYHLLTNAQALLKENDNRIILAENSDDSYMLDALSGEMLTVNGKFSKKECDAISVNADKYGFIRRQCRWTNFDYLQKLSDNHSLSISGLLSKPKNLSFKEEVILLLLAAEDKIYISDAFALGIPYIDIESFKKKFPIIVEELPVEDTERNVHSGTKLVHNSRFALQESLDILSKDHGELIKCIRQVVITFKDDTNRSRIYKELILFDTLNQLFGGKSGSGHLIFEVYENLSDVLNDSMHYWLQRAKGIYRIMPYKHDSMVNAYQYAVKAHTDGDEYIKPMAALTLSLICCLLIDLEKEDVQKKIYHEQTITYGLEAVTSRMYKYRKPYLLNNELSHTGRAGTKKVSYGMLVNSCEGYIAQYPDGEYVQQARELKEELNQVKKKFDKGYRS